MRIVVSRINLGETEALQRFDVGNDAISVWCMRESDTPAPVFALYVLGPGEHDLGSATNRYTLIVDVGDAQLPDGRLVSAGEKVVFKRGEKVRLRCKEPVVCHAETI